jgi:hypothetical protein
MKDEQIGKEETRRKKACLLFPIFPSVIISWHKVSTSTKAVSVERQYQ